MLAQRLRRWPNIETSLFQRVVFTGIVLKLNGCWSWAKPSKHSTWTQCWFNVGPPSQTVDQHQISIGSTSRVCWEIHVLTEYMTCVPKNRIILWMLCQLLRRWYIIQPTILLCVQCAISTPGSTRRSTNGGLMLRHRLRRWPNINTTWINASCFAAVCFNWTDTAMTLFHSCINRRKS